MPLLLGPRASRPPPLECHFVRVDKYNRDLSERVAWCGRDARGPGNCRASMFRHILDRYTHALNQDVLRPAKTQNILESFFRHSGT